MKLVWIYEMNVIKNWLDEIYFVKEFPRVEGDI